jgi:hypothetical protein
MQANMHDHHVLSERKAAVAASPASPASQPLWKQLNQRGEERGQKRENAINIVSCRARTQDTKRIKLFSDVISWLSCELLMQIDTYVPTNPTTQSVFS